MREIAAWGTSMCALPGGGYVLASTILENWSRQDRDIWMLRLTASGEPVWSRRYGARKWDGPAFMANVPNGGLVLCAGTKSAGAGKIDSLVMRLTADGDTGSACDFIQSGPPPVVISPQHIEIHGRYEQLQGQMHVSDGSATTTVTTATLDRICE